MWEERLECVRVRTRRASIVRSPDEVDLEDDELSEETWDEIMVLQGDGEGESPLIPLQRLDDTDGMKPPNAKRISLQGGTTTPEVTVASDSTPRRLVLSGWGESLQGRQRFETPHSSTCSYALLSAEVPFFQERVLPLSNKFAKGTDAVPMSWNQPDLRILYQFASQEEYLRMAANLKDGRLSKVKGYRAVTLEPVRLIDAALKASLEFTFPSVLNQEVKTYLKPLLDSVGVAQHFLYISTGGQKPPEDAPPTGAYPSLLFTFITSQSHNSTAMKVLNVLSQPQWSSINLSSSLGSLTSLSLYHQVFMLSQHRGIFPLFSLATGQAGSVMDDSIRLTLLCGNRLREMTRFYQQVLATSEPFVCASHAIFPLVTRPQCTVELCLLDSSSLSTITLQHPVLHVYVDDVAMVMWELGKDGHTLERNSAYNCWMVADPCGNRVGLVDRRGLEST